MKTSLAKVYAVVAALGLSVMASAAETEVVVDAATTSPRGFLNVMAGGALLLLIVGVSLMSPRRPLDDASN